MNRKASTLWVVFFFAVLTVFGLLAAVGYGMPLDGPSEQVILQENLKEYAVLLFGEDSSQAQGYDALGIQCITESIEMDHGQAAYYPAAPLLQMKAENPYLFNILWHMYTWLWFMAGVIALYAILRSLSMSRFIACGTALLFYLSPRFFAEGHYNNKDVVLLALTLWTIAAGIRLLQSPNLWRAFLFALTGALAANLRIIGFFVFGVMGITVIIKLAARRELNRKAWGSGAAALLGFLAIYILITPAFFVNPAGFITHLIRNTTAFSRWTGVVIFKGTAYDPTRGMPLPHSYLPTLITYTVPVAVLVLAVLGGIYAVVLCLQKDTRRPVLLALMVVLAVPAAYAVLARPLMYNGWRHFYFLYGPIMIFAGFGLLLLQRLMAGSHTGRIAGVMALALVVLWQGVGLIHSYPYEYAYYNELAGDVEGEFELDYWEVSTLNAMLMLAESDARNPELPLVIGGGDHMSEFSLLQCVEMLPNSMHVTVTEEENPPYVFSNSTYAQIYAQKPGNEYRILFSIESYGHVICTVYERL